MKLKDAADNSAQEDHRPRDLKVAFQPTYTPSGYDQLAAAPITARQVRPSASPFVRRARRRPFRRSARLRKHWKRKCLRRRENSLKRRGRMLVVTFSLSATMPLLLLVVII